MNAWLKIRVLSPAQLRYASHGRRRTRTPNVFKCIRNLHSFWQSADLANVAGKDVGDRGHKRPWSRGSLRRVRRIWRPQSGRSGERNLDPGRSRLGLAVGEEPGSNVLPVDHRSPGCSIAQERTGGEGGIRTPDTVARMPHFECGAFNHSATSPGAERRALRPSRYVAASDSADKGATGGRDASR
jgi:hypothetical protein